MVSKLRGGVLGSRARSELKESWQTRSQLMGERNGCANSVLSHTCGRGGVAGGVTVTSPRCCKGRTDRPSLQSQENGPQTLQRRVERRTEKLGVWKQRTRSSEQGLMPESTTFWVNASRAIPLLTFTDVNNNSIFIFFLVSKNYDLERRLSGLNSRKGQAPTPRSPGPNLEKEGSGQLPKGQTPSRKGQTLRRKGQTPKKGPTGTRKGQPRAGRCQS